MLTLENYYFIRDLLTYDCRTRVLQRLPGIESQMEKILDPSFRVNNICELGKILFSKIDCWFFNLRLCVLCGLCGK